MPETATEIAERATGVLYHYTSVRAALNILKSGQFELSSSVGVPSEEKLMPRGYPYFLSTTRSLSGDYHRITGNTGVMFVLDGDYFNRRGFKVRPIDYWQGNWSWPESGRGSESEDRIYSQESTIPAKNIREVHVLVKTQDDLRSALIRQLMITAKQSGIATYLYKDDRDWRIQNRRRALGVSDALNLLRGREPADRRTPGTNYLGAWLELVHKKSQEELSDRAKKLIRDILIYNRGQGDDDMNLGVDLGNARKPDSQNRDTAIRIVELLKKYDLNTKRFVQMLHHKWHEIEQKTTEGLEDPRNNPCWKGYHPVGTKKKNGRTVPNCVPNESQEEDTMDLDPLTEVRMAPGDLRRWAESPEAEGIRSGFEAEFIFRNATVDEEEDYEPDYDQDERARDISQVVDFFQGGEQGISRTSANRLRDRLWEEFIEWREEAIMDQWEDEAEEQVRDYMETNVWGDDGLQDQYREQAAERLGIETSEESADRSEEIEKVAQEIFEEDIQDQIENQGNYYEDARDSYRDIMVDSDDFDESSFFDDRYRYMSDVGDAYGLDWPYWRGGERGGGDRTVDEIATSLRSALGDAQVVGSSGYHSTSRRPGRWIVEPDGSLEPDDYDDAGLEVVSPPQPLAKTLEDLDKVLEWANGDDGDAYTNSSTGLHMGVSVPYKGGDVDYVKLILFLGDQYILEKFGRSANNYCRSALEKLKGMQRSRRDGANEKTAAAIELMRKNLIELAGVQVQQGVGQDKYTSAHIQDGYIEFRSPGGDYLSAESREMGVLRDTMLRIARAMHIASRPDLERREYSKKLYKLIDAQGDDSLRLFLDYTTGTINRDELKKQWAEQVLAKEPAPAEQEPMPDKMISRRAQIAQKIAGRPKITTAPAAGSQTRPGRYHVSWVERQGEREVQDSLNIDAANADAAMASVRRALEVQDREIVSMEANLVGSTQDLAQQRAQQSQQPQGEFTGRWQVKNANTGEVVYTFGGIGNVQADANRVAQNWIQQTGYDDPVEVVPEMG